MATPAKAGVSSRSHPIPYSRMEIAPKPINDSRNAVTNSPKGSRTWTFPIPRLPQAFSSSHSLLSALVLSHPMETHSDPAARIPSRLARTRICAKRIPLGTNIDIPKS